MQYRLLNTATFQIRRRIHTPLVDRWIAVSKFLADRCRSRGIEARVLVNFATVPLDESPLGFGERRGALFVGRLTPEKGVRDVLDLAEAQPTMAVRVAGSGLMAAEVGAAESRIANLRYLGHLSREDLRAELRAARVVLLPSRCEDPGPLTALEAMSCGTPIVAYKRGGLGEYVGETGAGRVVNQSGVAFIKACVRLATDEDEWRDASRLALTAASERHSIGHYLQQLIPVYEDAIGDARGRGGWRSSSARGWAARENA
jgi:glycosyltransferase involved in cell wall biosynthesis